ncbi:hypothetical protein ACH5RR_025420 [Cinchona calisaya]|uniref:NFP/LYK4/5 first LysM domain-containing protein n=1 Tax=Cinchona calisaya TaxID=153742 RepID=A0ABD2Z4K9_9GENT
MLKTTIPQHNYDNCNCTSEIHVPNSNYQCSSNGSSCETFIVYRARKDYQTPASIACLFNSGIADLLPYNNLSQVDQNLLQPCQEIIIPVICSCLKDTFYYAVYPHNASHLDSLSAVAGEIFEGLEELRIATQNFDECSTIGEGVYRGKFGHS